MLRSMVENADGSSEECTDMQSDGRSSDEELFGKLQTIKEDLGDGKIIRGNS